MLIPLIDDDRGYVIDIETKDTSTRSEMFAGAIIEFNPKGVNLIPRHIFGFGELEDLPAVREFCFGVTGGHVAYRTRSVDTQVFWEVTHQDLYMELRTQLDQYTISEIMDKIEEFQKDAEGRIFCNPPGFDFTILKTYCEDYGRETPWKHWHEGCFRTIKNTGVGHHVKHAIEAMKSWYFDNNFKAHHPLHDCYFEAAVIQLVNYYSVNEYNNEFN